MFPLACIWILNRYCFKAPSTEVIRFVYYCSRVFRKLSSPHNVYCSRTANDMLRNRLSAYRKIGTAGLPQFSMTPIFKFKTLTCLMCTWVPHKIKHKKEPSKNDNKQLMIKLVRNLKVCDFFYINIMPRKWITKKLMHFKSRMKIHLNKCKFFCLYEIECKTKKGTVQCL